MDDQVLMRVLNRRANRAKELKPFSSIELVCIRILNNWLARDILHDEVRQVGFGSPAVEQSRDVWMIQVRKYLTFVAKTLDDEIRVHAALDELDGYAFGEVLVIALSQIDGAHAAASNLANNFVEPDALTDHRPAIGLSGNGER